MAYKVRLEWACERTGCPRMATHEVFNDGKATMGKFCVVCADQCVYELTRKRMEPTDEPT